MDRKEYFLSLRGMFSGIHKFAEIQYTRHSAEEADAGSIPENYSPESGIALQIKPARADFKKAGTQTCQHAFFS